MKEPAIKIVMGLGNPDPVLAHTYHNVGLLALDAFYNATNDVLLEFREYKNIFSYAKGKNIMFVRPLVYMNESGRAAKAALQMARAKPEELFILHDDSDLSVGAYKISRGQNAAGHHGVESVINALHSKNFLRARIGIRPSEEKKRSKAGSFVLKPISKTDQKIFDREFKAIIDHWKALPEIGNVIEKEN